MQSKEGGYERSLVEDKIAWGLGEGTLCIHSRFVFHFITQQCYCYSNIQSLFENMIRYQCTKISVKIQKCFLVVLNSFDNISSRSGILLSEAFLDNFSALIC